MTTFYRVSKFTVGVDAVEAISFTEKTLTYQSSWGKPTRTNRNGSYEHYFLNYAEACAWAIELNKTSIGYIKQNLERTEKDLVKWQELASQPAPVPALAKEKP